MQGIDLPQLIQEHVPQVTPRHTRGSGMRASTPSQIRNRDNKTDGTLARRHRSLEPKAELEISLSIKWDVMKESTSTMEDVGTVLSV